MIRLVALAALVAACSSPAPQKDTVASSEVATPVAAPAPIDAAAAIDGATLVDATPQPDGATRKLGAHGAVCRIGERHRQAGGGPAPIECGDGLHCCYPCGIQGCDFTCMTQAECDVRRP